MGHYASDNVSHPRGQKCQVIEMADCQTLRMRRGRALEAAMNTIMPHPLRFKHVWHLAREKKVLYAWRPVPPEGYVALGTIFTSSGEHSLQSYACHRH